MGKKKSTCSARNDIVEDARDDGRKVKIGPLKSTRVRHPASFALSRGADCEGAELEFQGACVVAVQCCREEGPDFFAGGFVDLGEVFGQGTLAGVQGLPVGVEVGELGCAI